MIEAKIESNRFSEALTQIDAINAKDPNIEGGIPAAVVYSNHMSSTLLKFHPGAGELLQLAARGQHIQRWSIPRENYPMDRKGYLLWRTKLKQMHSNIMIDILSLCGYNTQECQRVSQLILKKGLKSDMEVQALEDVVCLVFLRYYFDDFLKKHNYEESKILSIVQKTWIKMSKKGQGAALDLEFSESARAMIKKALTS